MKSGKIIALGLLALLPIAMKAQEALMMREMPPAAIPTPRPAAA